LLVQQASNRAVIDWNAFSIGPGNAVQFSQPGAGAAVLNRVTGNSTTDIAGSLSANGQVFLVNPNGIAITSSGAVRVGGGFVASTLDVGNADFLAGRLQFAGDGPGQVANAGAITARSGGFVALVSSDVRNDGLISVPQGRVGLGAGSQATLDLHGDRFLQVAWPESSRPATQGRIDVAGTVQAPAGRIELSAASARDAVHALVHVSGNLVATTAHGRDGEIVLDAGAQGTAQLSGRLDVSGRGRGGRIGVAAASVQLEGPAARLDASSLDGAGGDVTLSGSRIDVGAATLDADGGSRGGSILVGGGLHGAGPLQRADETNVRAGAHLTADATRSGSGGIVVLWSDGQTRFEGSASARGAGRGNGGTIEVSSHGLLDYAGQADLRAPAGRPGDLLLDPFNVTISTGADTNHNGSFTATGNSSIVKTTTLQAALATANVTVSTGSAGAQSGDITVANALTWASGTTLTLSAARDVLVNAAITATGGGGFRASAGRSVSVTRNLTGSGGAFNVNLQGSTTTSGSVTVNGATVSTNGGSFNASASQSAASTTAVNITNSTLDTGGGTLTITGQHTAGGTSGTASKAVGLTNASLQIGTGSATINGTAALSGAANFASGIYATGSFNVGGTGNLTLVGNVTAANASTSAIGIQFFNGSFNFANSHASLSGSGVRGFVSDFQETITVGGGSLAVTGTGTNDSGVQFKSGNTLVNGGGTMTFAGSSGLYRGLDFIPGASLTVNGNVSMSGTNTCSSSCRDTAGVQVSDNIALASGNLSITGTAVIGPGFLWGNGNTPLAGLSNAGAGTFSVSGTSVSGDGVDLKRSTGTTSGALTFSGSSTSGIGFDLGTGSSLTQASGALALSGNSTNATGLKLEATSALSNAGTGTLTLNAAGGASSAGTISSPAGALSLGTTGTFTQPGGSISAGSLLLGGSSGRYALGAAGNQITTVAANAASIAVTSSVDMTVGSVLSTTGVVSTGAVDLETSANLRIAAGASVQGSSPVVAAGGNFINNAGAGAVTATTGRWLVYSAAPTSDTFGGLSSANTAIWSATAASLPPTSVAASGNRYLFANQPTLSFRPTDSSKVYGTDASTALASTYAVSGFDPGIANAYLGDNAATSFTGSPALGSPGAAATASVAGGPYGVSIARGTVTPVSGYATTFSGTGLLSVTPKALTITANDASQVYGSATAFAGSEFTSAGLVNGDSVSSLTLASAGAAATARVGTYAITGSAALGSGLSNYTIGYANGTLSVTPKALTVTANNASHVYGDTTTFSGSEFTSTGLVNGDAVTSLALTSAGAAATAGVGTYAITGSAALGSGLSNYTIRYANGTLSVTPKALTVTANNASHVYGDTTAFSGSEFTSAGLVNGDTVSSLTLDSAGAAATAGAGSYAIRGSAARGSGLSNYAVAYANGVLTVAPRVLLYVAQPAQEPFGATNGHLTGQLQGFVNGDTAASTFRGTPRWTATATTGTPGVYAIIGSGLQPIGPNYTLAQAPSNAQALRIFAPVTSGIPSDLMPREPWSPVGGLAWCGTHERWDCVR
ncbi:MAG: beta strand repeat-containing protein, partial [Vitreoscilla sp.]